MPGHLGTQMGQHLIRLSVAALKAEIPSFRRSWACLHTTGYFRGDSLRKSHLKTERTEFWNKVHWKGMNRATDHQKMWGWILQPSGVLLACSMGGMVLTEHRRKSEAVVGAGPKRKFLLYYLSSSSLLMLWMDFGGISKCVLHGYGPGLKSLAPAMKLSMFPQIRIRF